MDFEIEGEIHGCWQPEAKIWDSNLRKLETRFLLSVFHVLGPPKGWHRYTGLVCRDQAASFYQKLWLADE